MIFIPKVKRCLHNIFLQPSSQVISFPPAGRPHHPLCPLLSLFWRYSLDCLSLFLENSALIGQSRWPQPHFMLPWLCCLWTSKSSLPLSSKFYCPFIATIFRHPFLIPSQTLILHPPQLPSPSQQVALLPLLVGCPAIFVSIPTVPPPTGLKSPTYFSWATILPQLSSHLRTPSGTLADEKQVSPAHKPKQHPFYPPSALPSQLLQDHGIHKGAIHPLHRSLLLHPLIHSHGAFPHSFSLFPWLYVTSLCWQLRAFNLSPKVFFSLSPLQTRVSCCPLNNISSYLPEPSSLTYSTENSRLLPLQDCFFPSGLHIGKWLIYIRQKHEAHLAFLSPQFSW